MSDQAATDAYVLSKAPELLTEMVSEAARDAANLESFLEAVKRRPKTPLRDFAVQSLERMIHKHSEIRSALAPCQRMVAQYLEKGNG